MMIGADFEKIAIDFYGITVLEPSVLISDVVMGGCSIFFATQLYKKISSHSFVKSWYYFFLIFGIGSILGGFAHAFYIYGGPQGKFPTWVSAILCAYFIEQAMIKSIGDFKFKKLLSHIAFSKMILVFLIVITVISSDAFHENHSIGFIPIAINSLIGVFITVSTISFYNRRRGYANFKYFIYGVLVMLPSFFVYMFKLNISPWFDKNDFAHLFILIGNFFFYHALKKFDYSEAPFKTLN